MEWLKRWFSGGSSSIKRRKSVKRRGIDVPPLVMRKNTTLPIVDWDAMDAHAPTSAKPQVLDEFWTAAARAWLDALRLALGRQYSIRESNHFLLLSPSDEPGAKVVLDFVELARKRILRVLDGVARDSEIGKVCLLIFTDLDRYYQYVSNYYPPEGEFSLSGGMFLQHGYGHFVFVANKMRAMEPTIAHELTHCMVQHLPLPAWLNEGMAVNTEHRLCPPGRPLYTPDELQEKHAAFWSETTIQEFWSGKSWLRPGEANTLSYDLAKHFVSLTASDFDRFRKFANAADVTDGGDAAARKHLGYPIAHLADAVLGEGPWQPKPQTWKEGVERGQFR